MIGGAFIIDAHDREVIVWRPLMDAGAGGSDGREPMQDAVEIRFGRHRSGHPIEMLSDSGSPYTAPVTRIFAGRLDVTSLFTPVKSPQSNGISEAL